MFLQSIFYGNPDYYPPMIHGATVLDRSGIQQQILARRFQSETIPAEAIDDYYPRSTTVLRLDATGTNSLWAFLKFTLNVFKAARRNTSIFVGYNAHGLILAKLLATIYGKPWIYHCHDYVDNHALTTNSARIFKLLEYVFARTADLLIVPDHARAQVMVEQLKLPRFPAIVANCPITSPDPESTLLGDTLAKQGKHFERIVWRQGMINVSHGIEVTIRSMPFWASQSWGFVLLGPGEPKYKDSLIQLATEVGVADRFVILPPLGDYREVAKFTIGADLGHALYEPFQVNHKFITTASNKTMEYQSAGLPLLLADTPNNRQFIETYRQGILVDVTSPEAIADGINRILINPELAQQMSEGGQRAFREEFNYEHQYLPVIERMQEIIEQRRR